MPNIPIAEIGVIFPVPVGVISRAPPGYCRMVEPPTSTIQITGLGRRELGGRVEDGATDPESNALYCICVVCALQLDLLRISAALASP